MRRLGVTVKNRRAYGNLPDTAKKTMAELFVTTQNISEVGRAFGFGRMAAKRVLEREDMKPFLEEAQARLLSGLPDAIENALGLVGMMPELKEDQVDLVRLSWDASKEVMQAGGVTPSKSETKIVANIFNQQNIGLTPQVMELLRAHGKALEWKEEDE